MNDQMNDQMTVEPKQPPIGTAIYIAMIIVAFVNQFYELVCSRSRGPAEEEEQEDEEEASEEQKRATEQKKKAARESADDAKKIALMGVGLVLFAAAEAVRRHHFFLAADNDAVRGGLRLSGVYFVCVCLLALWNRSALVRTVGWAIMLANALLVDGGH